MVAYRRGGAFCKGIVNTARRRGLPFAPAKGSKTGQRGTKLSPLQTPLTLSCAGYEYCFSLNNREKQIRTAHRCAPKAAAGVFAPTLFPSPVAGEGPSGQIAACSIHRLGSMTFCYRFAVTPHKMRRRHLESVSSRSLSVRGSLGTAPSAFWYGAPGGAQDLVGRGGCTAAGRTAQSEAQGQSDSSGGCVRRAYGFLGRSPE